MHTTHFYLCFVVAVVKLLLLLLLLLVQQHACFPAIFPKKGIVDISHIFSKKGQLTFSDIQVEEVTLLYCIVL